MQAFPEPLSALAARRLWGERREERAMSLGETPFHRRLHVTPDTRWDLPGLVVSLHPQSFFRTNESPHVVSYLMKNPLRGCASFANATRLASGPIMMEGDGESLGPSCRLNA